MKSSLRSRAGCFAIAVVCCLVVGMTTYRQIQKARLSRRLVLALEEHHGSKALELLDAGADPNVHLAPNDGTSLWQSLLCHLSGQKPPGPMTPTALMIACGSVEGAPNEPALARLLLDRHADINVCDGFG